MNFVDVLGGWVNASAHADAIFLISVLLVIALVLYTLAGMARYSQASF